MFMKYIVMREELKIPYYKKSGDDRNRLNDQKIITKFMKYI